MTAVEPGRDTHPVISRAPRTGTMGRYLLLGIHTEEKRTARRVTRELRTGQTFQAQLFTKGASPRVRKSWLRLLRRERLG